MEHGCAQKYMMKVTLSLSRVCLCVCLSVLVCLSVSLVSLSLCLCVCDLFVFCLCVVPAGGRVCVVSVLSGVSLVVRVVRCCMYVFSLTLGALCVFRVYESLFPCSVCLDRFHLFVVYLDFFIIATFPGVDRTVRSARRFQRGRVSVWYMKFLAIVFSSTWRCGHHWMHVPSEESTLSLYVNGFEVTAQESGVYLASVWSPFSVVEKCQVAVNRGSKHSVTRMICQEVCGVRFLWFAMETVPSG